MNRKLSEREKYKNNTKYWKDNECGLRAYYRLMNKEKHKLAMKKYYENNKEKVIAGMKKWQRNNKEKYAAYQREYILKLKNKDRLLANEIIDSMIEDFISKLSIKEEVK